MTHRDHFVVAFTKEEIVQRLRIFTGKLPDDLVAQSLNLKDTGTLKLPGARQEVKTQRPEDNIYPYAYRPFDTRWVCYEVSLIDRNRHNIMQHILNIGRYLKDRKGRKLSLDEINHYMKVAKAIRLTIELQERIDDIPFHLPQGG
jgi:hypothetical protein